MSSNEPQDCLRSTNLGAKVALALLLLAILAVVAGFVRAAADQLDSSFGFRGKVITKIGSASSANGVALQPDEKIVVVGSASIDGTSRFALARYRRNGTLDTSFGLRGKVVTAIGNRDVAFAVALQPDRKIVAVGVSDNHERVELAVVRYEPDGSLDSSFGLNGRVTTPLGATYAGAYAVAIQPDGKIVAAGSTEFYFALVRYNRNGSLDTSFGAGGTVTTAIGGPRDRATAVAVQRDGKLVVAGRSGGYEASAFALARYNRDGSLDSSFGRAGIVTTRVEGYDEAQALVLQSDGKILVAGESGDPVGGRPWFFALLRYSRDGSLDPSFGVGPPGVTTTLIGSGAVGRGLALLPNGNLVVAGEAFRAGRWAFAVAEYDRRGRLDPSFGKAGRVRTSFGTGNAFASGVAAQDDGKIVAAGTADADATAGTSFALARYLGRFSCRTPDMRRRQLVYARRAIAHAHCAIGRIKWAFSPEVRAGRVISQWPKPGVRQPENSKVSLLVSKGKRSA